MAFGVLTASVDGVVPPSISSKVSRVGAAAPCRARRGVGVLVTSRVRVVGKFGQLVKALVVYEAGH